MATRRQVIAALRHAFGDIDADDLETTTSKRIVGVVVSDAFRDDDYQERQHRIRAALESALGSASLRNVGPIVAVTTPEAMAHPVQGR